MTRPTVHRPPPTDGTGEAPPTDRFSDERARRLTWFGMIGYLLLLITVALLGFTLGAAALDTALAPWIVATVLCAVLAFGALIFSRRMLTLQESGDRAAHDPLIPEVTAEEAAEYEQQHHRSWEHP